MVERYNAGAGTPVALASSKAGLPLDRDRLVEHARSSALSPADPSLVDGSSIAVQSRCGAVAVGRTSLFAPCRLAVRQWFDRDSVDMAIPAIRLSDWIDRLSSGIGSHADAHTGFGARPGQSPSQSARQLPDPSTIIWVDCSSTGYPSGYAAHSGALAPASA
jgi:hypothetical protein